MKRHTKSQIIVPVPIPKNKKFQDLTGKKFGRLLVKAFAGNRRWICLCDCGAELEFSAPNLFTGATKSCGCLRADNQTTHGKSRSLEYASWQNMLGRCQYPSALNWHRYGGRGIKVCAEWQTFENFLADMGPKPTPDHSIERRDNNSGYSPDNCYWATRSEQQHNKCDSHPPITFMGRTLHPADWARSLGMKRRTLMSRLRRGWTVDRALTKPVSNNHQS